MKNIILALCTTIMLFFGSAAYAYTSGSSTSTATGGIPVVPCWVDGEKISSGMEITKCQAMGGKATPDHEDLTWVDALPLIAILGLFFGFVIF